ncbi:MAG: hypothetical protein L3K06_02175 [Thermoplasmata archaeon]|nr:hypothetical protein [Thermoplasmata archaeon]MCI4354155.1 hypothetical protein [Thermoplasmata archaeon]
MPAKESKSVLRSIRIRRELQETLERDAATKGISVNALVTQVLTRYAEWDRYAEKFGFVTIAKAGYLAMVDAVPEEDLDRLGEKIGGTNPREMTLFWFKRLGLDPFLRYLHLVSRYSRTVEFEVDRQGPDVTLLVRHDMTERHSRYLTHFFAAAIHSVVGAVPRSQTGRNSIVFRFRAPAEPPSPTG